jgi:hypothetical protein
MPMPYQTMSRCAVWKFATCNQHSGLQLCGSHTYVVNRDLGSCILQAHGMEALCDIAEVAEAAGAEALELWLDCRQHPSQSMLLPGLAAYQGLAICVSIPGVC